MERGKPTGIEVIIVGAGLGGLFTAVEMWRQGHSVQVLESKDVLELTGDFIGIGPSATRQFEKWPGMPETFKSIVYKPALMFYQHDGIDISGPFMPSDATPWRPVPVARPKILTALYNQAVSLGISVTFGRRVVDYYESIDKGIAGVVTEDGERIEADLVIAADGVGSKAGKIITGKEMKSMGSGYSNFRAAFPTSITHANPFLAEKYAFKPGDADHCQVFLGHAAQMIILVARDITNYIFNHEDDGQAEEVWSKNLNASNVLESMSKDVVWDERVIQLVKQTPPNSVVDYKLSWRDPDPAWTSPGGRVLKLGDSAHAFLPSSTNGATQAMEDGSSIAACLKLAGKDNIALATRIHTKLRFERVSCCQLVGFRNRNTWDKVDFDEARKNPAMLATSVGRWISDHNPEQYVYDQWQACMRHVLDGTPFKNTNLPPGHTYKPWTIAKVTKEQQEGREILGDGNWE